MQGKSGVVTAESDPLGLGGLHSHATLAGREGTIHWRDGLSSDFSFVSVTIFNNEGSKPVSCRGLPQCVLRALEDRLGGKPNALDGYSIGSLSIANQPNAHLRSLTCDQDPTTQHSCCAEPT